MTARFFLFFVWLKVDGWVIYPTDPNCRRLTRPWCISQDCCEAEGISPAAHARTTRGSNMATPKVCSHATILFLMHLSSHCIVKKSWSILLRVYRCMLSTCISFLERSSFIHSLMNEILNHAPMLCRNWLQKALTLTSPKHIKEFQLHDLGAEIEDLRVRLSSLDSEIGFCHNDLQYGNIMMDEEDNAITMIVSNEGFCTFISDVWTSKSVIHFWCKTSRTLFWFITDSI